MQGVRGVHRHFEEGIENAHHGLSNNAMVYLCCLIMHTRAQAEGRFLRFNHAACFFFAFINSIGRLGSLGSMNLSITLPSSLKSTGLVT